MMDRFLAYKHHCMTKPKGSTFPVEDIYNLHILATICSKTFPSSSTSTDPFLISLNVSMIMLNNLSQVSQ